MEENILYHLENIYSYLSKHGEEAFKDAVYYGAFSEVSFSFIHPSEELEKVDNFFIIQKAFINAYV